MNVSPRHSARSIRSRVAPLALRVATSLALTAGPKKPPPAAPTPTVNQDSIDAANRVRDSLAALARARQDSIDAANRARQDSLAAAGRAVTEARNALTAAIHFDYDRSDITEELTRLRSHLDQFEHTMTSEDPVGRTLDFLLQEIGREVNTIGSKGNDAGVASHVVTLKSEIEKIREQVQNIE